MRKINWKNVFKLILLAVFVVVVILSVIKLGKNRELEFKKDELYQVSRVVDGDTFEILIRNKIVTIRLLGINSPESVDPHKPVECFGKESSDFTRSLLQDKKVKLRYNPNREKRDKYDRHLLYAYLENGLFVNDYLVKEGYAKEYTYGKPYEFRNQFIKSEKEAKKNMVGLWGKCNEQ